MWLKLLSAVVIGLFMYVGASLMFNNIITSTSQSATLARNVIPPVVAVVVVGITAMGMFNHH